MGHLAALQQLVLPPMERRQQDFVAEPVEQELVRVRSPRGASRANNYYIYMGVQYMCSRKLGRFAEAAARS